MNKAAPFLCLLLTLIVPSRVQAGTLRLPADSVAAVMLGGPPVCRAAQDSRYGWESGELRPLLGLFSFYPADLQPLEVRFEIDEQVTMGGVLGGFMVFNEAVDRLECALWTADRKPAASVRGFPVDDTGLRWAFLVGISSTTTSGAYTLEVRASRDRRFILYKTSVDIRHRSFRSEEISFNQSLSELLTKPDPRKVREYRDLQNILSSFDPRSVFHSGILQVPVQATRRTSLFADRRLYSYTDGGSSRSLHNGLDLAAPVGTPVFASGAGRVVMARERIISGRSVVIEHLPGVFTLYYHLETVEVEEGQRLSQGQRIGTVGMTGLATGPHLHWELRVGGVAVDPELYAESPMIDKSVFSHNIMEQN